MPASDPNEPTPLHGHRDSVSARPVNAAASGELNVANRKSQEIPEELETIRLIAIAAGAAKKIPENHGGRENRRAAAIKTTKRSPDEVATRTLIDGV